MAARICTLRCITVLLALTSAVTAQLSAPSDITDALNAINTARANITATTQFQLTWSATLATAAQAYITSNDATNVAATVGGLPYSSSYYNGNGGSVDAAVKSWVTEGATYDPATGTCSSGCSDYTALIYAYSTEVGCGVSSDTMVILCYYTLPDRYNTLPYTPSSTTRGTGCATTGTDGYCAATYTSQSDISAWVTPINAHRQQVSNPAAINMTNVTWSTTVAFLAQSIVEQCLNMAPDTIGTYGSTYYSAPVESVSQATVISTWYNEYKQYNYATNTYTGQYTSNYTQMVLQSATTIGCAHKQCQLNNNAEDTWLCLYDSAYVASNGAPYTSNTHVTLSSVFTSSDQAVWVEQMNTHRAYVNPSAVSMPAVSWNTTLANIAQTAVAQCSASISTDAPAGSMVDQGIATQETPTDINSTVSTWFNEYRIYDYTNNNCRASTSTCSDYLQMVDANATQFGCGWVTCNTATGLMGRYICTFDVAYDTAVRPYVAVTTPPATDAATNLTSNTTSNSTTSNSTTVIIPQAAYVLSGTQQTQLVSQINSNRSNVSPAAANMRQLVWNETLASIAIGTLGSCSQLSLGDNSVQVGSTTYGATISVEPTGQYSLFATIQNWMLQSSNYVYTRNTQNNVAGSYLQLVNADTSQVGCATMVCNGNDEYVCIFDVPYNSSSQPYVSGTPCTSTANTCTHYYSDTTVCNSGLCTTQTNLAAASQPTTTAPASSSGGGSSSKGLSGGAAAGVGVGVSLGVILLAVAGWCCYKRRSKAGRFDEFNDSEHYAGEDPPYVRNEFTNSSGL